MVDGANKINNDSVQNQYYKLAGINPDLVCNSNSKPLPLVNQPEDKNQPFAIGRNNIHFELPPNAPVEAVEFTDTLVKNKAKLMEELHINSDTYNMLAQTAVGIARKETNFGTDTGYKIRTAIRDSWIKYDRKFLNPSKHDFSMGMTQIKYTL